MNNLKYIFLCIVFINCNNNDKQYNSIYEDAFEYYLYEMKKLYLLKGNTIFLLSTIKTCEYCKNDINDIKNYLARNISREKIVLISAYSEKDIHGYKHVIYDSNSLYMKYVFPKSFITFYKYSSNELEYTFINSIKDAQKYLINNNLLNSINQ